MNSKYDSVISIRHSPRDKAARELNEKIQRHNDKKLGVEKSRKQGTFTDELLQKMKSNSGGEK